MAIFIDIPGIEGDATDDDHSGEIELTSLAAANDSQGGTGSSFRPNSGLREVAVSKRGDRANGAIIKAAASGEILRSSTITITHNRHRIRLSLQFPVIHSLRHESDGGQLFSILFKTFKVETYEKH